MSTGTLNPVIDEPERLRIAAVSQAQSVTVVPL